jgi:hypothetical protein
MVSVASAASTYNPAFYWIMGYPASFFSGTVALYVMRIVAALLCAAFVALAGWSTTWWARTRWPLAGLLAALTPVAIYSTALAAPNGIEMCAAISLWVALLGLTRGGLPLRSERTLLYACIPGAVVLATVRSLGPLWLSMIVASIAIFAGRRRISLIARHSPWQFGLVCASMLAAVAASIWWILASFAPHIDSDQGQNAFKNPFGNSLMQLPVWLFQGIAAFPYRDQLAPMIVYISAALVLGPFVGLAVWRGHVRLRVSVLLCLALSFIVPLILSTAQYSSLGAFWQGRYGLPYTFGLFLMSSLAYERMPQGRLLTSLVEIVGWAALVAANTVSVLHVLSLEISRSPSYRTGSWVMLPGSVVAALTIAGWAIWGGLYYTVWKRRVSVCETNEFAAVESRGSGILAP